MWLEAAQQFSLIRYDTSALASPWKIDVVGLTDEPGPDGEAFIVGRVLADSMSRFDIEECGEDPSDVADSDSSGLSAAWESLVDKDGEFRSDDFQSIADPVVYIYRFYLHPDFAEWRIAVMDAVCRLFGNSALILAQHHTTYYSQTEFDALGFVRLIPAVKQEVDFMARENACARYSMGDYPREAPDAFRRHQEWLEAQAPWKDLLRR